MYGGCNFSWITFVEIEKPSDSISTKAGEDPIRFPIETKRTEKGILATTVNVEYIYELAGKLLEFIAFYDKHFGKKLACEIKQRGEGGKNEERQGRE